MLHRVLSAFALSVALALPIPLRADGGFAKQALNSQAVLSDFSRLFLHERADDPEKFVMKLDRPISYFVFSNRKNLRKIFAYRIGEISEVTDIHFRQAPKGDSADIYIGFVNTTDAFRKASQRILRNVTTHPNATVVSKVGNCVWMISFNPRKDRIKRLLVVYQFTSNVVDRSIDCVNNALWRFTGPLGNDLAASSNAVVFTKASVSARPSDYEKSLLSLLYDKRIRSGMNRDAAIEAVKSILLAKESRQ